MVCMKESTMSLNLKTMSNRKLSKAEKKAIIDKHQSAPASEVFTDEEWARLMFASHSEIKGVMQDIIDKDKDKE